MLHQLMGSAISWNGCWGIIMINAYTEIVRDGYFFHYCHKIKGLMAFRIHYACCPLCFQKNPDYTKNKLVHVVINLLT